jgi:hypothetical protein
LLPLSVATIGDGVTTSVGLKEVASSGAIVMSFCGVILTSPLQSSYTQKCLFGVLFYYHKPNLEYMMSQ